MTLKLATTYVLPDEPAVRLSEINEMVMGGTEFHRFQVIYVIRGEGLVEFKRDLGPTMAFTRDQFAIACGIEKDGGGWESANSVGQVMEMANENRQFENIPREEDPPDFRQLWWDENERKILASKHKSQFGAGYKKERQ